MTIELHGLTKRYGGTLAVDDLTFAVQQGCVTGFLGPNGAGKSTTLRLILGLDQPTAGEVTVNGLAYRELHQPLHHVGALLEANATNGGRSAYNHLLWLAFSNGIPRSRVRDVLDQVGLLRAAKKRTAGFSLGMAQRLGIAAALLGDPSVLLLDEPVNGLDPEGVHWIRELLKTLAEDGRTVLLSSHLMSEMAITADRLIIIGRGRLIADTSVDDLLAHSSQSVVRVRTPEARTLAGLVTQKGGTALDVTTASLRVGGLPAAAVGELATTHDITLWELATDNPSLEDVYLQLTGDVVDYPARSRERAETAAG
jgi:ABC-2 type transport system ATP-binding protein